jgi:hypothetical protein
LLLGFLGKTCGQDGVAITLHPPRASLFLSDRIEVELAVEGPAPLRVQTPPQWLTPASQRDWGITPLGPSRQEESAAGRERWLQRFRLEPYVAGAGQMVAFAALRVNEQEYDGPVFEADVRTHVQAGKSPIRPIAPAPEEIEAEPAVEESSARLGWLGVFWTWLALLGAAVVLWQCQRRPETPTPRQWALKQWEKWEAKLQSLRDGGLTADCDQRMLADEMAGIVREYLERRWGWPARCWTTAEVLAAAAQAGWPIEHTDMLQRLLDVCDRLRFTTHQENATLDRHWFAAARAWLDAVDPPGESPGTPAGLQSIR